MKKVFFILFLFLCPIKTTVHAGSLNSNDTTHRLVQAAIEQTKTITIYSARYFKIDYPNGDIPKRFGVCSDVVIRAYRALGIDLQERVHKDMKKNFNLYPPLWGLKKTDPNIDHRRVPNLQIFFKRFGERLPITQTSQDYRAGDLVTWNLNDQGGFVPHIGIVTDQLSKKTGHPMIVHNIGLGPQLEDMLFDYKITGHYRYGLEPAK